jgi:hypothetical protein
MRASMDRSISTEREKETAQRPHRGLRACRTTALQTPPTPSKKGVPEPEWRRTAEPLHKRMSQKL